MEGAYNAVRLIAIEQQSNSTLQLGKSSTKIAPIVKIAVLLTIAVPAV
jgi:hypothetical protein